MKKYINKFKYNCFLVFAFLFLSCDSDFLEVSNPNEVDANVFFNSVSDLNLSLTSIYSALSSFQLYGESYLAKGLIGLSKESDQRHIGTAPWNQVYQNQVTPENGFVNEFWSSWYRVVGRANDLIENAENFKEARELNPADRARVDQMIGEALFLRGLAYFHLVRLFGEDTPVNNPNARGVPIILQIATTREEMAVARASVEEVYDQILADFDRAKDLLPEVWPSSDKGRANKFSAIGYIGKVHVFRENWEQAIENFELIYDSGLYEMVPFERYDDLFRGEEPYSEESLFEIGYSIDMQEDTWAGGTGSNFALLISPIGTGWSNLFPHDVNILRFGNDPRLRINALEPGVDEVVDGAGNRMVLGRYVDDEGALGWSFRKYVPLDNSVFATNRNHGANMHLLRMADIYLLHAEASLALGNETVAAEYMNKVRRRAYNSDFHSPNPGVDYTNLSGIALRDSIREERFRELFMEGHRWFDLQRWRIAAEELAKYPRVRSGAVIFEDPRGYYFPIPQLEMDANPNMVQSDGY
ncbi:RagB/SusD family nutrient uptake outer membrane protein [Pleomorphovibrio marinus]|uniref:RagB/SusD family nutrient uptake outer membrane protein n=1 Tax=Pleomorphovibrio marinus TaxID=2164132 RepID=UPI000E0A547D|nr:RagB/SusD family nutrient uptake outer membrane protein [Pleomorphovibrio marinus]